jgi:subtilisin family serine protease
MIRPDPRAVVVVAALSLSPSVFATEPPAGVYGQPLAAAAWQAKVDPGLLRSPAATERVLVVLAEQADLGGAARVHGKQRKGRFVYERLREVAARTQGALVEDLARSGAEPRPFWIVNMVAARADPEAVRRLAGRPEVARILADPTVRQALPAAELVARAATEVEPNLQRVRAPQVFWARGFTGQGVVIAGQDTGVDWRHPALRGSYRGAEGAGVAHDYNWHDAIHDSDGRCGVDSREPCDDGNHGTHTLGIAIGREGEEHQIGVAPGARWIACRNMDDGAGTPSTYSECFQWMLAPTDLDGANPDPTRAPDVITNSWICPPSEGCIDPTVLDRVVRNVRAAGIVVVASAGNDGPDCSSLAVPPSTIDASLTVGALSRDEGLATFSSRGPVTIDGSGRVKPDIAAPGVGIVSSVPGTEYVSLSGTSMAAPHVAGMAALVLSAAECLRGDPDGIEAHLLSRAKPRTHPASCGGISGDEVPNPFFGFGQLRAALPRCPAGIGGYADGLSTRRLNCRDQSGGGRSAEKLGGPPAWRCTGGSFSPQAGDRVQVKIVGTLRHGEVGGVARELELDRVTCRNRSTGQSVNAELLGGSEWDCASAGLTGESGDRIVEILVGRYRPG